MKTIYDQAALCGENNCCPVVTENPNGAITISDPKFPGQGAFTFKDQAEAATFFANAPAAFQAHLAAKKS